MNLAPGDIVRLDGERLAVVLDADPDGVRLAELLPAGMNGNQLVELPFGSFRADLRRATWRSDVTSPALARLTPSQLGWLLKAECRASAAAYYRAVHADRDADAGVAPVGGRVFGPEELGALVDASLDFWLTAGPEAQAFEAALAHRLGRRSALLVNSGSSANLLTLAALCEPELDDRRLRLGDEVLTTALAFPTSVAPIFQLGLTPVFVDVDPETWNARPELLAEAVGPRTRAILLAHTLGNPFPARAVLELCREHDLWLVEDACDALGGLSDAGPCGAVGDLASLSFYPAHQITCGEGGAVLSDDPLLARLATSLRDWGRDCVCPPGADDVCGHRWSGTYGKLPAGYDHKYVAARLGYNLKATDLQGAVGRVQLRRLDAFVRARAANYAWLREALTPAEDAGLLRVAKATPSTQPCWFGLPLTLGPPFAGSRPELLAALHGRGVASRLPFAGNMLRQPAMRGRPHRVAGELTATDTLCERGFWLGVYPGITPARREHMARSLLACLGL